MSSNPGPRHRRSGPARAARTTLAALAAGALLLGACGDDDTDAAASQDPAAMTTTPVDSGDGEATPSPTAVEPQPIVDEFHPIDPGVRTVDTLGIPLELELTGEWWVQPNHAGFTVLTHPDSQGPGDRDVVMIRPTALVEPDGVNDSAEDFRSQDGWPLSDIDGWLEQVPSGLVDGDAVETTLGGREAVRFDVELTDDFPCGPDACAGFVTNDWMDNVMFQQGQRWTIWWVDGGDHGPLVVLVGREPDDTEWLSTAEGLLDTVELGEPGPHPLVEGGGEEDPVAQGEPGDVSAGQTVETPRLGGLRFVVPEDRSIYQAPGLVIIEQRGLPVSIDLVLVVETLNGEPIDSVDTVVSLIDEAAVELVEAEPTTVAGHQARVLDFTAERDGEPRPEDAVFRFEQGGIGGWGPIGEGRVWLLDSPRGILLFSAVVFDPGAVDLADVIEEAETIFATLELVDA